MNGDVESLKRACPMPALLHKIGLGEFAKNSVRSPFREEKNPSWGIFQREGKWFFKDQATGESGDDNEIPFWLIARCVLRKRSRYDYPSPESLTYLLRDRKNEKGQRFEFRHRAASAASCLQTPATHVSRWFR